MSEPALRGAEVRMVDQVFPIERSTHALPLFIGYRASCDKAILCLIDQVHRPLVLAHIKLLIRVGQACHRLGPEQAQHRVQHRQPNMLPFTRLLSRIQRGTDRLGRGDSCYLVSNDDAEHLGAARNTVGLNVRCTGERLNHRVIYTLVRVGPLLPKTADRYVDELLVNLSEHRLPKPHTLHGARPEILDQHVRGFDQIEQDLLSVIRFQVDSDGLLTAVTREECGSHFIHGRANVAHLLTRGGLDLDNVSALIRQHHRCDRTRHHTRQVQHLDPFQCAHASPSNKSG